MDRRHDATFDADCIVQHLGKRSEAVRRARAIRDHLVVSKKLTVVHTIDHCTLNILCGGRDEYLLCAALEVDVRLEAVVKFTRALQNHVAARPIELFGVISRHHINRATTKVHCVALDFDLVPETAMNAIVF